MESIAELKIKCQSEKKNKNFLLASGYFFHRNISIYITRFLLIVFPRIKPNQVTFFLILISILGALLLASSNFSYQLIGILLVYFGFILDKVDGEVARYKELITLQGGYLDELYHFIVPSFLLFGFLYQIIWQDRLYFLFFSIILMLNILNRLNRKIYLILYVKYKKLILDNKVTYYLESNWVTNILNSFLFRIFSLIERFDLVILTIFVGIMLKGIWQVDIRVYYLYTYFIFSSLYFFRWTGLNYFGNLEKNITRLTKVGY